MRCEQEEKAAGQNKVGTLNKKKALRARCEAEEAGSGVRALVCAATPFLCGRSYVPAGCGRVRERLRLCWWQRATMRM